MQKMNMDNTVTNAKHRWTETVCRFGGCPGASFVESSDDKERSPPKHILAKRSQNRLGIHRERLNHVHVVYIDDLKWIMFNVYENKQQGNTTIDMRALRTDPGISRLNRGLDIDYI